MADLFKEIIPSILVTKKNALQNQEDIKSYPAFMVSRALSYYPDTVMIANEINQLPQVDADCHYTFLLNTVKPYKRPYAKWFKKVKTADLDVIKEYYGYSYARALEVVDILSPTQIADMKKELEKGE
jgi:hypothetical protein